MNKCHHSLMKCIYVTMLYIYSLYLIKSKLSRLGAERSIKRWRGQLLPKKYHFSIFSFNRFSTLKLKIKIIINFDDFILFPGLLKKVLHFGKHSIKAEGGGVSPLGERSAKSNTFFGRRRPYSPLNPARQSFFSINIWCISKKWKVRECRTPPPPPFLFCA